MDEATETRAADFWTRMRRRKVVQWGIAYAAGAWGLLQGIGFLADAFHWPDSAKQLATLALLIGLPIALVLAWYHGDRGQRRVSGIEFAILVGLFLAGGGIFWWHQRAAEPTEAPTQPIAAQSRVDASDPRPSIAVLPFENRSAKQDDAFFVDGMHDDILTQLSRVSGLRVISRTSVERFRETDLSVQQIAQQLGVKSIVEGGVQRAGDRVRINVQLIDAATDAHHWADSYDRELTVANMFAIQTEVAGSIAGALKTALTPVEQTRARAVPTQILEAWEAYQLGKQRLEKRTTAGLADAERFFREAIDLDPKFALAYVGLADALDLQVYYSGAPSESTLSAAERAAAEALKLDPNLAEAWASAGAIAADRSQYDRAEPMYRRSIELNPNYAPARHWYGSLLGIVGRLDDALSQIEQAVALDPLSGVLREALGQALVTRGRIRAAEAAFRRAITIDPSRPSPYANLAFLNAYALDRFADAVPLARKSIELDAGPYSSGTLATLYFDLGDDLGFVRTTEIAARSARNDPYVQFLLALVALLRSDTAGVVRHAQRAQDELSQFREALAVLRNADLQSRRHDAAIARYEKAYPNLMQSAPRFDGSSYGAAIDIALVAQRRGDNKFATELLDGAWQVIRTLPRLSNVGYGISDVQILALRGERNEALRKLREAEKTGWRGPLWRYHRDFDPNLDAIRNEPEFKAIFADIERDMAQQRARLAARPKDAQLDLAVGDSQ